MPLRVRPALTWICVVLAGPSFAWGQGPPELVAPTEARTAEAERQGFRLPPGFVIELVASEPDIYKPMNLAFDARGRLWVTSSIEYPYPAKAGVRPRDRLTVLDDFGPDGRARRIVQFADDLNIPIGVLPLREGVLVHSIPNIYHLKDTNGDGKSDEREVWYGTYGFRDTHGMTSALSWGFDGWIYACHGFSNSSEVKGKDGQAIRMNSGNTYRMRPDGSHVEQVTWGQVNPFGLTFDPLGNLFSVDCHSRPIMMLLREGYYQSFGKPHDGLGFAPEIMAHNHDSTGIAGIVSYAAEQFPAAYRGSILIGNVVTSRINRDSLRWTGSSPKAIAQPDFVVSEDPWFRPVDLELGPDGCLYVADFYNKIIGHYEVPLDHPGRDRHRGRIWRVRYEGPEAHAEPTAPRSDWHAATIEDLISDLGHGNLAVRLRAANELAERGGSAVIGAVRAAVNDPTSPRRRAHALWVAQRLGTVGDAAFRDAAYDRNHDIVRTHAMTALAEQPTLSQVQHALVLGGLTDAGAFTRRAAAGALARHASAANLRPLLAARHAASEDDPQLVHMLRIALRNQLRDAAPWARLAGDSWSEADRRALADVARGVHTVEAARYVLDHVRTYVEPGPTLLSMVEHIARYGDSATEAGLTAWLQERENDPLADQVARVKALAQGAQERGAKLSEPARSYAVAMTRRALGSDEALALGVELASILRIGEVRGTLAALGIAPSHDARLRGAALGALVAIDPDDALEPLGMLVSEASTPPRLREQAASLLGQLDRPRSRALLIDTLQAAPAGLQTIIAAALAGSRRGAEQLLETVAQGKASPRLLQDRTVAARLQQAKPPELEERIAKLTEGLEPLDQAMQALFVSRRAGFAEIKGSATAGADVFKKHCAACHQLDNQGTKIGPQLDGIGARGTERLLEDILDPNRNVDQTFRVTTLALDDGRVLNGLIQREEGDLLVLADNQGKEVRVPKGSIVERTVTGLSLMPPNLAEQVPEREFYDLLAYLLSKREAAKPSRAGE